MKISLSVSLPRDSATVPIVRAVATQVLGAAGFEGEDIADLALALTEACTNVLLHSRAGDDYDVTLVVAGSTASIEVCDNGRGFDATELGRTNAPELAEEGRGIQLMRALMDDLYFESGPESGAVVRMVKHLRANPQTQHLIGAGKGR